MANTEERITPTRAAAILRAGVFTSNAGEFGEAMRMGAAALELLAWADTEECPEISRANGGGWHLYTEHGDRRTYKTLFGALAAASSPRQTSSFFDTNRHTDGL